MIVSPAAAVQSPRLGPALITVLHLLSLGLFIHGFLLTRVHLPERAAAPPAANASAAPYDRVVWLMIDALRYDFVVQDGRYSCPQEGVCHQGHMPFLARLSRQVGK
jgi:predicted AlkP superfamily pyrophosphatase or phosphodiesterase